MRTRGTRYRSAGFQACCVAGFQTRGSREAGRAHDFGRTADLEIGDTAGLETCGTSRREPLPLAHEEMSPIKEALA